jgi:hypothetical protein
VSEPNPLSRSQRKKRLAIEFNELREAKKKAREERIKRKAKEKPKSSLKSAMVMAAVHGIIASSHSKPYKGE